MSEQVFAYRVTKKFRYGNWIFYRGEWVHLYRRYAVNIAKEYPISLKSERAVVSSKE